MIDCQSLRAFQILKSLKFFCMVTILNLKNLTAGIYPLLLLCRQTFPQLKDSVFKNFSMVSWCFQVRSWPDISYFIFFFFSWPPRSIILAPCQIWRQTRVNEIYENIIFGSDCFLKQAPKAGGCASWTNAYKCKMCKIVKIAQRLWKMIKGVQKVQESAICVKLWKMCKSVHNMQNCATYAKLCKMCKVVQNLLSCAKSAKSAKI